MARVKTLSRREARLIFRNAVKRVAGMKAEEWVRLYYSEQIEITEQNIELVFLLPLWREY